MTHRLTTNYAKNYCNLTLIVKVIEENVVTCFFGGHSVYIYILCDHLYILCDVYILPSGLLQLASVWSDR